MESTISLTFCRTSSLFSKAPKAANAVALWVSEELAGNELFVVQLTVCETVRTISERLLLSVLDV